jgi:hypothetical protein
MTGKKVALLILAFILSLTATAGAIEINASIDKQEVALGDPITLRLVISGRGGTLPEPTMPDLSAFDISASGRSQNISIVNGAFSSTLTMDYRLYPRKVGDQIIGPIVVRDGSGMASTEPIKIKVNPAGTGPSGQSQGAAPQPQGQQPRGQQPQRQSQATEQNSDFFITQIVDKTNPYVGEQVTLTFRFYQAVQLWDQPDLEWPKYPGVTVEDLVANNRYYEIIRGRRYLVTEFKRAIFPILAGKTAIASPTLTIKPDDFGVAFDPFGFFDRDLRELMKRGQPKVLTADVITLNVRPLPGSGKPADYSGAVGTFAIDAVCDKDSVGVDEPITFKLVLSGTGNIRSIPPVKLPDLPAFRIYDSGSTESISNSNVSIKGIKTFEQAIIPKTSGVYTIPAISFSYFDPARGAYKSLTTDAIRIIATGEGLTDVGGAPKNIIGSGAKSLGYIITDFPRYTRPVDFAGSFLFWFLQFIPAAAIVVALVYRSKTKRLLSDRGYARRMGAGRRSKALFKKAEELKSRGVTEGFYAALYDAVLGYAADKLNLEKSGLTIEQISTSDSIPEGIRRNLSGFLENCQTARFAPGGAASNHADRMMARAGELVARMEREI